MNVEFVDLTAEEYWYWERRFSWIEFGTWEELFRGTGNCGLILVLEESDNVMSHRFPKFDTTIRRLHLLDSDKFTVHPHSTYVVKSKLLTTSKVR